MNDFFECIAGIGFDVVKDKIKDPIMEVAVRERLTEFLEKQRKINFNCTREEEIDFGGIADYIRRDLIEDAKLRFLGNRQERETAHKVIVSKASQYACANTKISEQRAKKMISTAMNILKNFYEKKANRELSFLAGRIEDTVIEEMSSQHDQLSEQIQNIGDQVSQQLEELKHELHEGNALSLKSNLKLAAQGQWSEVNHNLSIFLEGMNSEHPLKPYYAYNSKRLDGKYTIVSIPLCEEAEVKYPPGFSIVASHIRVGQTDISELQDVNILNYAYRHQLPIVLDVSTAQKLLGDIPDPIQDEARQIERKPMVLMPPKFPEAFPCRISINEETIFDYLLMRTKEILDNGTILATNEEEKNRAFDVSFTVDQKSKRMDFNIRLLADSNNEKLKFRKLVKRVSEGGVVTVKALALNTLLGSGNLEPVSYPKYLDDEIVFLEKLLAIETYFHISLPIPAEISRDDHEVIDHVYSMVSNGVFKGHWSSMNTSCSVTQDFKDAVVKLEDTIYALSYICTAEVGIFDQVFSFTMKRELRSVRFKDLEKLKRKVEAVDINDTIRIDCIPDDAEGTNIFIDSFAVKEDT